jgi:hypothetical protein
MNAVSVGWGKRDCGIKVPWADCTWGLRSRATFAPKFLRKAAGANCRLSAETDGTIDRIEEFSNIRRSHDWPRRELRMNVVECGVPSGSMLSRELIERAYFRDSYRAPLSRTELGIVDIFFGIFAHHPLWMKLLLIVRNKVASLAGLDAPTASEILHVEIKDHYVVGEKIGVWPIFSLSEDEVVAGRNNKHMDFRLSVLKVPDGDGTNVVVSTICTVHNLSGKLYLFFVIPFHRYGVRKLMANALAARRL